MINLKDIADLIEKQETKWIKINEFEFQYKKLGGKKLISLAYNGNAQGDNTSVYISALLECVSDWRNVTLKNIVDCDNNEELLAKKDELVEFDQNAFDKFLSQNLELVTLIFTAVQDAMVNKNEKLTKQKKTLKTT